MDRHYFLGGNTPHGFYSYYDYLIGQREANKIFVIKGGPGTGKSTLMKKVAAWGKGRGYSVDFLHCSSDPESLDGIILREIAIAMVDGTAPHVVDPKNPGCVDTILYMGDCWNEKKIRAEKEKILRYNTEIKEYFDIAYRYIKAAVALCDNIAEINAKCLSEEAVSECAAYVLDGIEPRERDGKVRKLFLDAISPEGYIGYADTFKYPKKYLLCGEVCGGGGRVIDRCATKLTSMGYDTECFFNPFYPDTEISHISVPELGMFVTTNDFLRTPQPDNEYDVVDIDGRLIGGYLAENSIGLSYSKHMADNMLRKATSVMKRAKEHHDLLESCYVPYMDFEKADIIYNNVIKNIESLI